MVLGMHTTTYAHLGDEPIKARRTPNYVAGVTLTLGNASGDVSLFLPDLNRIDDLIAELVKVKTEIEALTCQWYADCERRPADMRTRKDPDSGKTESVLTCATHLTTEWP